MEEAFSGLTRCYSYCAVFLFGQQNIPIAMKDGIVLFGDLYRPAIEGKLEKGIASQTLAFAAAQGNATAALRVVTILLSAVTAAYADVRWPVVLIRTPLNKNEVSPDLRHPGMPRRHRHCRTHCHCH